MKNKRMDQVSLCKTFYQNKNSKACSKMNTSWNIRNLDDILAPSLNNGEKIINKNISSLTLPGENYGSIMLRVDVEIKNENTGRERTLHTVAKLVPESEKIQEVFNTQLTYRNEYKLYAQIIPILDKLLKSKGITNGADFVPPFFGGRLNLDGSEEVNVDALILMENLKPAGYTIGVKTKGFNIEGSQVVLNALATFHAAGIALKYHEPETFKEKVEPYCLFYLTPDIMYDKAISTVIEKMNINGFTPAEIDLVTNGYKKMVVEKPPINETWATITHYDSWTNNFLIKYDVNKPIHAVLVDFQMCHYRSPLCDVMFFLLTSVEFDLFEESIDPLLNYYYTQLLYYLKQLEVDTKPFTKSSFDEEVKFAAKYSEFTHALWMMFPILHEDFKSVEDLNKTLAWAEKPVQKVLQITRTCLNKGWLN